MEDACACGLEISFFLSNYHDRRTFVSVYLPTQTLPLIIRFQQPFSVTVLSGCLFHAKHESIELEYIVIIICVQNV